MYYQFTFKIKRKRKSQVEKTKKMKRSPPIFILQQYFQNCFKSQNGTFIFFAQCFNNRRKVLLQQILIQTMSQKSFTKRSQQNVSRQVILQWLNNLLGLELTQIQQLGSGAIYCRIFQMIHPGTIPTRKINWQAQLQHQFISNLRLLQDAFAKMKIGRPLELSKLAKAKFPDNFQLIVWLKNYFQDHNQETQCTSDNSLIQKVDFSFAHKKIVPKYFGAHPMSRHQKCKCCLKSKLEIRLMKQIQAQKVKFQMINEVLQSQQQTEEKLNLINLILTLEI